MYIPCAPKSLGLFCLEQRNQATSHCVQGAAGSCLSTQEITGLSTSTKRTLRHPPSSQGLLSTPSHTEGAGSQSTYAQNTVAHLLSTLESQRYTHHAQRMLRTLKFAQ